MSNDDIRSTMQFILEQQAQFAANFQKLEEVQLRDTPRLQRLEAAFVQLVDLAQTSDERLDGITSSQERLAAAQAATSEQLAELAAAQRGTEARMGELVATVQTLTDAQRATTELLGGVVRLLEAVVRGQGTT
jgi:hypothetical protein